MMNSNYRMELPSPAPQALSTLLDQPSPQPPHGGPARELTLPDLLELLRRRRGIMALVFSITFSLALVAFFTSTKLYKASAQIQVQKEAADAIGMENVHGGEAAGDAIESNVTLQTEAQILKSDALALRVVEALDLEKTADFQPKFSPIGWVLGLFATKGTPDPKNVPLEQAPGRRTHAVKTFQSHLKVEAVSGTRLINVYYYSSDRQIAAAVVNELVKDLVNYNFETRQVATAKASEWLQKQLGDLKAQSEALQARLVELQHDSGMFTLGQTDNQGREQVYTPALDRLQQLTAQLAQAESARVVKGAIYQVVENGDPELISGLAGSATTSGASAGLNNSLTLLQGLRAQQAAAQAELAEANDKFGPGYPKVQELEAKLKDINQSIKQETQRLKARAKNDYEVAQNVEARDRAAYDQEKSEARQLNGNAVGYEIARQEAEQSRDLYASLLKRLREADLIAGLRSSNITIVDPAEVPARPAKPNLILYLGGGLVGGMFFAVCAALFRESTDTRIQRIGDLSSLGFVAPIAFLPHHPGASKRLPRRSGGDRVTLLSPTGNSYALASDVVPIIATDAPRAPYTEALRALRTTLMQRRGEQPAPQVVLITSSLPQEGKSLLSVNLAAVFAQSGKRVLLVDADLRTPVLHERLGRQATEGLSEHLISGDETTLPQPVALPVGRGATLDFLAAGAPPELPSELLGSDAMLALLDRWRGTYDYIFLDGAPVLPVTDSAVLSPLVDYTVIVARHNQTDRVSLGRTCRILEMQGLGRHGIVLNGVRDEKSVQYGYYGYSGAGSDRRAV